MKIEGLETARLVFRKLTMDDLVPLKEFFNNVEATRYVPFDLSMEENQQLWMERVTARYEKGYASLYGIVERRSGHLAGQVGLLEQDVDGVRELEIAYHVIPGFWNRGYATEAAIALKKLAFLNNAASSLISIIHVDNKASQKVALKNAMFLEKKTTFKDIPVFIFRVFPELRILK